MQFHINNFFYISNSYIQVFTVPADILDNELKYKIYVGEGNHLISSKHKSESTLLVPCAKLMFPWRRARRTVGQIRSKRGTNKGTFRTVHLRNCLYLVYAKIFTRTLIFQSSKNSAKFEKIDFEKCGVQLYTINWKQWPTNSMGECLALPTSNHEVVSSHLTVGIIFFFFICTYCLKVAVQCCLKVAVQLCSRRT